MGLPPLDFESSASTSFTTPAYGKSLWRHNVDWLLTALMFLLSSLMWEDRQNLAFKIARPLFLANILSSSRNEWGH